jgi:linoleate 10R-lipoxygenase
MLNERGNWQDPPPTDPERLANQDEQIFQTARLIKYVHHLRIISLSCIDLSSPGSCGHFMSLIVGDYAASFLGLSTGQFWDIKAFDVRVHFPCLFSAPGHAF